MISHRIITAFALAASLAATAVQTAAAEDAPPRQKWSFSGPFGIYDQAQLQRGFKIYKEVCSTCHSIKLLAFRNLAEPGGPASPRRKLRRSRPSFQVTDGPNDQGQMFQRPGTLADHFPPPFPNDQAARAALGGKLPPDMSVLAKARGYEWGFPQFIIDAFIDYQEDGPDYIHALLNGYTNPPAGFALPPGGQYNKYFPTRRHRHAEAPHRRPGAIHRRHADDGRSIRPRRRRLPDVGGGADTRRAQAARLPGDDLPHRADRASCTSPRRKSGTTCIIPS